MAGLFSFSEGVQEFPFPESRGAGRFESMGFPYTEFIDPFVGSFEVIAGLLILFGFLTRAGALTILIIMIVAIVVTKLPRAFGQLPGPFGLRDLSQRYYI